MLAPAGTTLEVTNRAGRVHATVLDGAHNPAAGVRVEFSAPSNGPSCALASSFAITDANGEAAVSCQSNCLLGRYEVTATPLGSTVSTRLQMTNDAPCTRRAVAH